MCSYLSSVHPQVPNKEQVLALSEELRSRSELPAHVPAVLKALPQGTHPMTQFSTAVLALQARPLWRRVVTRGRIRVLGSTRGRRPACGTAGAARVALQAR